MKYTLFALLLLLTSSISAQQLYDISTIQEIEITFAQSNWDQLLDNAYAADAGYIMAQSVTINGIQFDSVGVKYKGNSTYQANQVKNPFHIELDTYKDQEYDGFTDIKMSNVAKDPSFLREVLSYQILRQYMDAPSSNYANVWVNGSLIGLYSNSESVSRKFVEKHYGSKDNTRIKCNPPAGAGPQSNDFPNLVYLGTDSSAYYDAYEIKSDGGWDELIHLCDTLASHVEAIEQILDVDRVLWMLAFNNSLVNLDSYSGRFAQNYYLYRDDFGRFVPTVWDLNESFGVFSDAGSVRFNSTAQKARMSQVLHENDADYPLISQLLSVPEYRRKYLAHMKTMLQENFASQQYEETALELQNLIATAVQNDPNKFYSYNEFLNNLTTDIGGGGGPGGGASAPGITNLMDARVDFLLSQTDFSQTEPTISNVALSDDNPAPNQSVFITAMVENAERVYCSVRSAQGGPFTKMTMLDDGNHGDGAANDGIYGIEINLTQSRTEYYLYAENDGIGKFSPQRAEHEFYSITAGSTSTLAGALVINEFLASNDAIEADQDDEYDDWVELYNNSEVAIDLEGFFLSDDLDNATKWTFPAGTVIGAQDYLIIWLDDDEQQAGLHASFKLSADGEAIVLSDAEGGLIDSLTFASQETDISYGRYPNGTGDFREMEPTFNGENNEGTTASWSPSPLQADISIYPNPSPADFQVKLQSPHGSNLVIRLFSTQGQVVSQTNLPQGSLNASVPTKAIPQGLYFLEVADGAATQTFKVVVSR